MWLPTPNISLMTDSNSPFKLSYSLILYYILLIISCSKASPQTNTCRSVLFRPYHVNISPPPDGGGAVSIQCLWILPGRALSLMFCNANASFWRQIKANKGRETVCVCVKWGGWDTGHHFLFPFIFICVYICHPLLVPIWWFNCRDQQTYGLYSVARKSYIFVKARPEVPTVQHRCHQQPLFFALSFLARLFSNRDVGGFSPPLSVPCWGFIFTASPGQLYAKQLSAGPNSPCQLTLYPAGCLTVQSAPHLCPDQLHSPKAKNTHFAHVYIKKRNMYSSGY